MKKIIIITYFFTSIFLQSCESKSLTENIFDVVSDGNKVDILIPEKYNKINMKQGEEIEIPFKISNEQKDQKLIIKSSDPSVIEIISSKIGLIKALKTGQVELTIFYGDKSKKIIIIVE